MLVEVQRIASADDPIGVAAVEKFLVLEELEIPQKSLEPDAQECEAPLVALALWMALVDQTSHRTREALVQEVVQEHYEARSALVLEVGREICWRLISTLESY